MKKAKKDLGLTAIKRARLEIAKSIYEWLNTVKAGSPELSQRKLIENLANAIRGEE